jgi:hypothetical protein
LLEDLRCAGAVAMGLDTDPERVRRQRPATPKIAWVAGPRDNPGSAGNRVPAGDLDLVARILSLGRLHHAFTGTGSIAAAVAAAIPETLVAECLTRPLAPGSMLRLGHAAGVLKVGAEITRTPRGWIAHSGMLPRTARTLMRGEVMIPRRARSGSDADR